jgi:hypothetical protein
VGVVSPMVPVGSHTKCRKFRVLERKISIRSARSPTQTNLQLRLSHSRPHPSHFVSILHTTQGLAYGMADRGSVPNGGRGYSLHYLSEPASQLGTDKWLLAGWSSSIPETAWIPLRVPRSVGPEQWSGCNHRLRIRDVPASLFGLEGWQSKAILVRWRVWRWLSSGMLRRVVC